MPNLNRHLLIASSVAVLAMGVAAFAQTESESETEIEITEEAVSEAAENAEDSAAQATTDAAAAPRAEDFATKDIVYGEEDAPLTIVEYASFTCPHCMDFEETVFPSIDEEYIQTGKAKLIYREVYFDGAGLLAASLARCVPEEQYYPMVFTIYDTAETWLKTQTDVQGVITELTKLGVLAGLPKDKIAQCLDDRDMQELMIENSAQHMDDDNVKGTPTILVNGDAIEDWRWDSLKPFLDEKYEEATK